MSTVIIGGGHGGVQTAETLRASGYTAPIVIIDACPELPYQRPPLSKDYMKVDFEAAPLPIKEEGFYVENDITLVRDTHVQSIDRATRQVRTTAGAFGYDNLVIATGARPNLPDCPGSGAGGVHTLKTLADAELLKEQIAEVQKVVVVGAGFIGMEFAVAALKHGCEVTVLEFADRPMGRALTPFTSKWFSERYLEHGITMRFNEGLAAIDTDDAGAATAVVSTTGERYAADLVVIGIGVTPNVELAEQAGLQVANGIIVDDRLRTSDPAIFAIGDCASFPVAGGQERVRLESVQNAADQAKHVAAVILGADETYAVTPWFWSTQGRYRLQMTGVVHPDDDVLVIGAPEKKKFSVLGFRDGELIGAESVNSPADQTIVRRLFDGHVPLRHSEALSPDFDLRQHLKMAMSTTV